jgi:rod shape determining protein RodA
MLKKIFARLHPSYKLEHEGTQGLDWVLICSFLPLIGAGLVTMNSFTGDSSLLFKQLAWVVVSVVLFFIASFIDFRFLRNRRVSVVLFISACAVLLLLFAVGHVVKGSQSWFDLGLFSFQPADPVKLVLIIVLAKYFSRRHIEIANIRHILISGAYAIIVFSLILVQPDFGSAIIIFLIWLGMVLVSGISKKHILAVFLIGAVAFAGLWGFGFKQYQKDRIMTFVDPTADIHGSGYNVYQSVIAVGSGEVLGKGVGYGTQSRLKFLPEYQTDFIMAAFAEEWGFVGVMLLFILFGIVVWRIILNSIRGATNFEILFGAGLAVFIISHIVINVGMNIGVMPVTGITLPFLSYGGTHVMTELLGLGILMGMRRYSRAGHRDAIENEFVGPQ